MRFGIMSDHLMPNHVHIISVPSGEESLARNFGYVHRHYTMCINARLRLAGPLWKGRFSSVAMDLQAALLYVALNPVRARLVDQLEGWMWSITRALQQADDHVVSVAPVLERVGEFAAFLGEESMRR